MPFTSQSTGPPSRRSGETARRAILEAAELLLLRGGTEGVSVHGVAERSGFTESTVRDHFGDKTGLVEGVLEEHFRELLAVLDEVPAAEDAARHLHELARAFVRFAVEHPQHYRLLTMQRLRSAGVPSAIATRERVKAPLETLLREGTLATADVDSAFQVLWAVVNGLISLHFVHPYDYELADDLLDTTFEMIEAGLLRRYPR